MFVQSGILFFHSSITGFSRLNNLDLPNTYSWLLKEPGPKMLLEALKLFGIREAAGEADNPLILAWAKEVGLQSVYRHDSVAWCGLTMAIVAKRAAKQFPPDPLWALNWAKFGTKVTNGAMLGDVLVFRRQGGGHVGLYVGEDDQCYHVLGGNQSDMVNIVRKPMGRVYAIRRPIYIHQPLSVRKIILSDQGAIDSQEA